jgi:RimJ/RimL family protein N-acetyltransferase
MKPGTMIKTFKTKNGTEVVVRTIEFGDLDGLLRYANALIEEDTTVLLSGKPLTREEEEKYVKTEIEKMEKDGEITLVGIIDGKIIAECNLRIGERRKSHTAGIGISVSKEFRGQGIGRKLFEILIREAKKIGLKLLTLTYFESNQTALRLYESLGFKRAGMIPKALFYKGKYENEVIMYMPLESI